MNKIFYIVFGLLFAGQGFSAGTTNITVGGTKLAIPVPDGFQEISQISPQMWELMETGTIENNRLLGVFITNEDVNKILSGDDPSMERVLMLQTYRATENLNVSLSDFQKITASVKNDHKKLFSSDIKDPQADRAFDKLIEKVTKEYDMSINISNGVFKTEGIMYEIPAAIGLMGIEKYVSEVDGIQEEVISINAVNYILAHNKIFYAYVVKSFKNKDDLIWTKNISTNWSKSIITSKITNRE